MLAHLLSTNGNTNDLASHKCLKKYEIFWTTINILRCTSVTQPEAQCNVTFNIIFFSLSYKKQL